MEDTILEFGVVGYEYRKAAGKPHSTFRVRLKSSQGDSLTLVSDSKAIYDGFPEGETFTVVVKKAQKTMSDFSKGE